MLIPLLAIAGVVITQFGETDVQAQEVLFSTNTGLTIFTAMMVVSVVPFAEEFVFRGALYNALLPEAHDLSAAQLDWKAHRLPFLISMVAFVALHLIAGFGTASAILQIVILSTFLSGLRTITGSVWAPVIAHLCWNALAAVGLLATSI
ncbi:MAG: lysostaphin resistance A-like protein [Anaerolineae bacterium]